MIDPNALRALTALASSGTVARVAAELGFTPSAVSQQIKRLETQVGVPLVGRAGRGLVLTPAGEALVAEAPSVFESLERVAAAARRRGGEPTGVLRVVAFSTAIRGLLTPALCGLMDRHPDLILTIDEQDPVQAVHSVAVGTADLALIHDADGIPTPIPASLQLQHVHTDVGDVVVHQDHPLARHRALTSAELIDQVWVTSPTGTVCNLWFQRLLSDQATEVNVRHRIDDFSTQLALVALGDVVALIPRLARPPLGATLRSIPVDPAPTRSVDAVWRISASASPAIRAVLGALSADGALS